ncbi:MAG: type II secretion system F family protein [Phycisphaeraceae bacterium]
MDLLYLLTISALTFLAVYLFVRYGWELIAAWLRRQVQSYDRVLRHQLLIDIDPRLAVGLALSSVALAGVLGLLLTNSVFVSLVCAALALLAPTLIVRHLETKRREKLDSQLVDGLMTLSGGVRAGLNLVQAMEMLLQHHRGPIRQEFAQLLREYQMGMDLNQAMRSAANRIGSPLYRLTFTAIEMHRLRGGDTAESLDRIAESVREIQRLEGKLDALTAQGRTQAAMMAAMPIVFVALLWAIDPSGTAMLFVEPLGRLILLVVVILIAVAFVWIRRIMSVDI